MRVGTNRTVQSALMGLERYGRSLTYAVDETLREERAEWMKIEVGLAKEILGGGAKKMGRLRGGVTELWRNK